MRGGYGGAHQYNLRPQHPASVSGARLRAETIFSVLSRPYPYWPPGDLFLAADTECWPRGIAGCRLMKIVMPSTLSLTRKTVGAADELPAV